MILNINLIGTKYYVEFIDKNDERNFPLNFILQLKLSSYNFVPESALFSRGRYLINADPINFCSEQYLYHCMPPVLYCYRNIDAIISISFRLTTFSAESWLPYSVQSEKYI